jgi:hypothetical protein
MTDEEEFFAWLDGELPPAAAARVEARVAADPALAAEARAHRALGAGLRAAFDPVMTPRDAVASLSAKRAERAERAGRRPAVPQWAAIAATLIVGIGLGTVVGGGRETGAPVVVEGERMVAAAALDRALTDQLASADQQGAATRVGLTFRSDRGLCRTFAAKAASGVACRSDGKWRIEGLYGAGDAGSATYRMAAGGDPRLATLVDGMIVGDPLDPAGEAAARRSGWK